MTTISDVNDTKVNHPEICRTCLKKVYKNSINIFEERKNDKLISDILTEYISLKMKLDDGLPKKMCNDCLKKLNLIINFKVMAIESDKKLQNSHHINVINNRNVDVKTEELKFSIDIQTITINKVNEIDKNEILDDSELKEQKVEKFDTKENSEITETIENDYLDECILDIIDYDDGPLIEVKNTNNKDDMKQDEPNVNENVDKDLLKNIDLSEYEHLKKTLTQRQKKKTRLVCKLCNKSVLYYYFFSVHLPQHLGKVPYKCDVCTKSFVTNEALKQHKVTHSDTKPYTCELCGKSFKSLICLRSHVRVHTDDYPLECTICNKRFKFEHSLTIHLRRHKGEREYICEVCGKAFMDYSTLYGHSKIHDADSNFICAVCGKAFKTKWRLKEHNKQHTDYRPHKCSYCDRSFRSRTILKNHVAIHTGEKPFSCKVCGKTFRQNSCISRHMRTHTGETPFSCKICPSQFKYSHHLLNHMKGHQ